MADALALAADGLAQEALRLAHDAVEVERAAVEDGASTEGQQLPRQSGGGASGRVDVVELGGLEPQLKRADGTEDHRQEVVEVMGDAAREKPEGRSDEGYAAIRKALKWHMGAWQRGGDRKGKGRRSKGGNR